MNIHAYYPIIRAFRHVEMWHIPKTCYTFTRYPQYGFQIL